LIELVGELTERLVAVARIGKLAAAERIGRLPIHVEELLHESDGPFGTEDRPARRWLVTSCLAGTACALVAGAAVLGILGSDSNGGGAFASIQPFNSASLSPLKSDIGGKPVESVSLRPMAEAVSLIFSEPEATGEFVVPERDLDADRNYPGITAQELPYGDGKTIVLDSELQIASINSGNITTITKTPPPEPVDEIIRLTKDRTIVDELVARGVTPEAAQSLAAALDPVFPGKRFKEGAEFELTLEQQQDFYGRYVIFPVRLAFRPGPKENVIVEADEDGHFAAHIEGGQEGTISRYAASDHFHTKAHVGSSLYATAKDNGIPDYIITELTRVFAYDVDFQRQVKASDTFEVFYGTPLTGSSKKRKVLHYAQLTLGGQTKTYFRYTTADGQTDYYDENGRSATKSLLRTPVSGAKLTSGYGMRRHPLLGYNKMHTGVDFGAPYGTPIKAAGAGVVELAGRDGAYGIAVMIKHKGKYETLYGHMSKLADGLTPGVRVNQGQVIGYVGATGRATGPHLHYEVRVDRRPVNPLRVKAAGGRQLANVDLLNFKQNKLRIVAMMRTAPSGTRVAQVQE
jgi:murein DD-endopeptidase MepM/ murein hydrolase activator NlpD